tara:strand:+ start:1476 stop:2138 length:663 start_codon:yes stop_codon:yes gene_type:complete
MKAPSTSSSQTTAVSVVLPKTSRSALEQFEAAIGGRDALVETLELAQLDKKQEHLLNLLLDPKRQRDTINTIARDAGMKPAGVIELFRSATFAMAHALAMSKMASALPSVVDDIAAKSVDSKIECPTCFGQKQLNHIDCPTCYGKGEVMRYSDLDRQKILLESAGVTKKGGGVNVNVSQQVGIVNPGSFFSNFVKGSDADAYSVEPIDADIISTGEPHGS